MDQLIFASLSHTHYWYIVTNTTYAITKGGIHCISEVFPWYFYFMREHSLVELTEHDDSAANIIVHMIVCILMCTAAFIVHISVYR